MRPGEILIVDDDEDIRDVVGLLLEVEGFQVAKARDGLDALAQLQAGPPPALILLDMMMPRMDGESFVAAIRCDPKLAGIPVVIMSGHHLARQKAEELEAAGCLVKPVEMKDLLWVVHRLAREEHSPHPGMP
jgi:CheY-like chemotaxis protein